MFAEVTRSNTHRGTSNQTDPGARRYSIGLFVRRCICQRSVSQHSRRKGSARALRGINKLFSETHVDPENTIPGRQEHLCQERFNREVRVHLHKSSVMNPSSFKARVGSTGSSRSSLERNAEADLCCRGSSPVLRWQDGAVEVFPRTSTRTSVSLRTPDRTLPRLPVQGVTPPFLLECPDCQSPVALRISSSFEAEYENMRGYPQPPPAGHFNGKRKNHTQCQVPPLKAKRNAPRPRPSDSLLSEHKQMVGGESRWRGVLVTCELPGEDDDCLLLCGSSIRPFSFPVSKRWFVMMRNNMSPHCMCPYHSLFR